MGRRIGIVAGAGPFVAQAVSGIRRRGYRPVVLGIVGETRREVRSVAEVFASIRAGEVGKALAFFKENDVSGILLLGKVRPDIIFRPELMDGEARRLLSRVKERSATGILQAVSGFLEASGIRVLDPAPLLKPNFCRPGVLTRTRPSPECLADIDFGLRIARHTADLEIGQTLVVKARTVVAVEGVEGTDRTIRRGARLAGPGFVLVKAGRSVQDMRFDVPAVGLETVRALVREEGAALGLEAAKVAFFQRQEAVALADARGAAVVVRSVD